MASKRVPREPLAPDELEIHPATVERWRDLELLFGEKGACAGCWCMFWRTTGRGGSADENKQGLRRLVEQDPAPGLLAYVRGEPAGWCALAPREQYPRLERSRKLKRIDDTPVWSVVCFFVARPHRRRGMMAPLLRAALAHARLHGATTIEGYPVEPHEPLTGDHGYVGILSAYREVGFVEVGRASSTQLIMRYTFTDRETNTSPTES